MKLFRTISTEDYKFGVALTGQGAAKFGGRWNHRNYLTVYTATDPETSIAEKAYYVMLKKFQFLSKTVLERGRPNTDQKHLLSHKSIALLELEFRDYQRLVSITDDSKLNGRLKTHGLAAKTISDARKSPHESLPGMWTRELSKKEFLKNASGMIAKSARSDTGYAVPIFLEKIERSSLILKGASEVILAPANKSQTLWQRGQPVNLSGVMYQCGDQWRYLDVLNFPI